MRFANIALRGTTLVGKFTLIFFIAKFLSPVEVGLYGLLVVSVSYSLYLVGLEFYTYSNRDILTVSIDNWGRLIKTQGAFFLLSYITTFPLIIIVFMAGILPWKLSAWFFLILITEHISQEINRFLIICSRQLLASLILFIRSGLWCYLLIVSMYFEESYRSLSIVLLFWFIGNGIALSIGLVVCQRMKLGGWTKSIDWLWILRGLKVAVPLLFATLALRAVFTLDRYIFEFFQGLEALSIYVVFVSFCNALISFLDAAVFMYSYPKLIRLYIEKNKKGFNLEMRNLWFLVFGVVLSFSISSFFIFPIIIDWLGNGIYSEMSGLFWILLLAVSLYALSMVPHFGLYSKGMDKKILFSNIFYLLTFLFLVFVFKFHYELYTVPLALVGSSFLFLSLKTILLYIRD